MKYNYEVAGVSYVGKPKNNTAMFISQKVKHLAHLLTDVEQCIIFAENGIVFLEEIEEKNQIIYTKFPQLEYARFVMKLYEEERLEEQRSKYTLTEGGYYLGEGVSLGENVVIEPGCVIGNKVVIGDNTTILANSVIKNASIGQCCLINEFANIGSFGFSFTRDECGNWFRIPTMGKVQIGNYVEVGSHDNIARGTAGDTIIGNHVKIDALVHIGHDAVLGNNAELTAGGVIGGFVRMEDNSSTGINATIRNRITIGENSMIGMGSVVTREVDKRQIVKGNPARFYKLK